MKILITGIDGQLGNQLKASSLRGLKIIGLKRKQFNLLDNVLFKNIENPIQTEFI